MAPFTKWYYNSNTGYITELPIPLGDAELHSGLGWHGPFDTHQAAVDYYNANKDANPGWKAPTSNVGQTIGNAGDSAVDKFKGLNLDAWFIRIGEVLLGLVLVGVGIAKLTGTTNVISSAIKAKIP